MLSFNMVVKKEPAWVRYLGRNESAEVMSFHDGEKALSPVPESSCTLLLISELCLRWVPLRDRK